MPVQVKAIRYTLTDSKIGDYWIEEDERKGKLFLFLVPSDPDNLEDLKNIFSDTESKIKVRKTELPEDEEDTDSDSDEDSDEDE